MKLQVVIPVKTNSERVQDKNLRPFHGRQSLLDIKTRQLIASGISPKQIVLSSESERVAVVAKRYGARFALRDIGLTYNETPWGEVVATLVSQAEAVTKANITLWITVTDPIFSAYRDVLNVWRDERRRHDSLVLVQKLSEFVMMPDGRPLNWGFGPWHVTSQNLGELYTCPLSCVIAPNNVIAANRYYIGRKPYLYKTELPMVDIDTENDFARAQAVYREQLKSG